jgi:hypothetical protein
MQDHGLIAARNYDDAGAILVHTREEVALRKPRTNSPAALSLDFFSYMETLSTSSPAELV